MLCCECFNFSAAGESYMPTEKVEHRLTNMLIKETSPYLLQHAHNPVDWYPWGPEAFDKAEKEDKPVFLSIGYSTCHWCHVMEKESFEDGQIAKIINSNFVSIKVDREQRPDIDNVYMEAVQAMTGSGGWPLSVFLTPAGRPFYGGTYFPPKDVYGRIGFERLLLSIADAWKNRRQELVDSASKISNLLKEVTISNESKKLPPQMLRRAYDRFRKTFDAANGGFGIAPKFPQPISLSMLLTYWWLTKDEQALEMVEKTLGAMTKGGIYDHIGGGFHRYATDSQWLVPHFEKMLYDQALLSKVYIQAYQVTKNHKYAGVARETLDYVLRDMTDTKGGFYSAEDADSEGREGAFYLWTPEQITSVLDEGEAAVFSTYYGVTENGNFEEHKTILNTFISMEQMEEIFNKSTNEIENILTKARKKIIQWRQKRAGPFKDDKIITAWNGLTISSLAYCGAVLQEERYIKAAKHSAEFILSALYNNSQLMRYYRDSRAVEKGFLDDYAFLIMALVDLYEATFDAKWLVEAINLSKEMIKLFSDTDKGGFFLTDKDSEKLIVRTKSASDSSIPSGNSIAALALLKLGMLTMNQHFTNHGSRTVEAFSRLMENVPEQSVAMLSALNFQLGPIQQIVIAGRFDTADTKQMLKLIHSNFLPNTIVILHEPGRRGFAIEKIVPFVRNKTAVNGKATAYLCENYVCKRPVSTIEELAEILADIPHRQLCKDRKSG
jgi:uncharacterized protein YyaL (SSP411 family)